MKQMNENDLAHTGKKVSFRMMLERDIAFLSSISREDHIPDHRSIHEIRKSLKSVSAIFFLFKPKFDQLEYIRLKGIIKTISKQYGQLREPYIRMKTCENICDRIKVLESNILVEFKIHFIKQYHTCIDAKIVVLAAIRQTNERIDEVIEVIMNSDHQAEPEFLRRRLMKSYQKGRKCMIKLKHSSSSNKFHEFRKWCKILYLQQTAISKTGLQKTSQQKKKLYKLTEYLGKEHDFQQFYEYLNIYFVGLTPVIEPSVRVHILSLRKRILNLAPRLFC
jgi:CHAD domain-containing protein